MTGEADFRRAFRALGLGEDTPLIVHASLSAFGQVLGGAQAVVDAVLGEFHSVVAPVFTYKTMVTPGAGPPGNAMVYGSSPGANRMARIYAGDMPADRLMGIIPETIRLHPLAKRSCHPILSFAGIRSDEALDAQTQAEPLGPVRVLGESGGWVLLLGVNHTVNTSIHYAEKLAGRRSFIRWALTSQGMVECPGFPGCSEGFEALVPRLEPVTRQAQVGRGMIQAVPLEAVFAAVGEALAEDPYALLCSRSYCERCNAVKGEA